MLRLFFLLVTVLLISCNEDISNVENNLSTIQKLEANKPVVIGFIGGSITQGSKATLTKNRYVNKTIEKLKEKYSYDDIELINAGIGSTTSEMGCYRVYSDLLHKSPDLVFVDFSVNDNRFADKTTMSYEGLIRQILVHSDVISLFFVNRDFNNAEEKHRIITDHYGVPVISLKDTLLDLIDSGEKWEDFYSDNVHPDDNGHDLISSIIVDKFDSLDFNHNREMNSITENKYQFTKMISADDLIVTKNENYSLVYDSPRFKTAYRVSTDNSKLEFNFNGEYLSMLFLKNSDATSVEVLIDSKVYQINTFLENDRGVQTIYDFGKIGVGDHKISILNKGKFEFNAFMSYTPN